jgi:crossover junction endodeoxyribonuclease RuvC
VTPKRILGVDPGLNTTGYGVIEIIGGKARLCEAGTIRSRPRGSIESRVAEIFQGVQEVIEQHQPEILALEQLFSHYQRPRTAILMGHARGVVCLAAGLAGIPVTHFEPTRVKKVMTGNGRAPKHQIQQAVKLQLELREFPEPADVADALAIALCGYHLAANSVLNLAHPL